MGAQVPTKAPRICCMAFTAISEENRKQWRYQVLHQLCHSRVGFSLGQLELLADLDEEGARELWEEAVDRSWAMPAEEGRLLVGKLKGGKR